MELRVFGPPGTGKTTYITKQIARSLDVYSQDEIIVASLTRTAARELVSRNIEVDDENVGTLHSLCYRILDRPKIAEGSDFIDEWNSHNPDMHIAKQDEKEELFDVMGSSACGGYLSYLNSVRSRCIPESAYPEDLAHFAKEWRNFKHDTNTLDFTDLIERAILEFPKHPKKPLVGFFDEVQDFNMLELRLVRQWGQHMEKYMLVGDDDQCIYSFSGADPHAFLYPSIPDDQKYVLNRSYRVPRKIKELADNVISAIREREHKHYSPRDHSGSIKTIDSDYSHCEKIISDVLEYQGKNPHKTQMIIASCSYMLYPIISLVKREGIPFYNPYRKTTRAFNPISYFSRRNNSYRMLKSFLAPRTDIFGENAHPWTIKEFEDWTQPLIISGNINKKELSSTLDGYKRENPLWLEDPMPNVRDILSDTAYANAVSGNVQWFLDNITNVALSRMGYLINIYNRHGARAFTTPKLIIGTIHSVKGGEADRVYLFPDISYKTFVSNQLNSYDEMIRMFYVGITRAKEDLVVCAPRNKKNSFDIQEYL